MKKLGMLITSLLLSGSVFAGSIHLLPGSYVDTDSGDRVYCEQSSGGFSSSNFTFLSNLFYGGSTDNCKKMLSEVNGGLNNKATEGKGTIAFSCTNEGWTNGKLKASVNFDSRGSLIKFTSKLGPRNYYHCSTLASKLAFEDVDGASISFNCADDNTLIISVIKTSR